MYKGELYISFYFVGFISMQAQRKVAIFKANYATFNITKSVKNFILFATIWIDGSTITLHVYKLEVRGFEFWSVKRSIFMSQN